MKHFITISLFSIFLLSAGSAAAQWQMPQKQSLVMDGAFQRDIVQEKEPFPYTPIRESDVVWARKIWRIIDLREKINYPLYYPTEVLQGRKSLVQALVQAIQAGKITAYDTDSDEFTTVLKPEALISRFNAADRKSVRPKMDGTGDTTVIIRGQINWSEVQELLVKEEWFFDTRYSQMFVRIIGICPIRVYHRQLRTDDGEEEEGDKVKARLFWVYYPEIRKTLANTLCFTGGNEISQMSFDDLFLKRYFNSYIVAEANNQNNRLISSYARNDFEMMLESEKIKEELFNFEQDLWEY
ncbi:MAG: gliding motility protein GldN [Prevotellaceae bacterium]|jgi:gliding motility associated protien GldN|nr:gliding motility protein GldN [Prevotellaceae bacterium]